MSEETHNAKIAILVFGDLESDPRVEREAAALAGTGYTVRIFALRRDDLPDFEQREGFEIIRCADFSTAGTTRPLKKWRQLRRRRDDYLEALSAWKPSVIQACDADTLIIADRGASLLGVPYVFDAHELYSDMLKPYGWSGSAPVQAYWRRIEHRLIPKAARVLTVSEPLAEVLKERYGVEAVVQHNVPVLRPIEMSGRLRGKLGLGDGELIVLYQGVLNAGRDLFHIVEVFHDETRAHLVIQGFGPFEAELKERVLQLGLESRVHLMGRISADELHSYACEATFGIIGSNGLTLQDHVGAPNKFFSYLMAGLPVLGADIPFLRQVIEGQRVGFCYTAGDIASLKHALSEMVTLALEAQTDLQGAGEYLKMAARARHLAETRYNWEAEKHILLDLYEEVLAS